MPSYLDKFPNLNSDDPKFEEHKAKTAEILRNTVLILGPELMKEGSQTLNERFYEEILKLTRLQKEFDKGLENKISSQNVSIQERIFLLLKISNLESYQINECVKNVFDTENSNSFLDKLAQIPIFTYLSTTPDRMLANAFFNNGIKCQFDWYKSNNDIEEYDNSQIPLVYDLWGSVKDYKTMIRNYQEFIDYLEKATLSADILAPLQKADSYVFLGFDFDEWYLNILLSKLRSRDRRKSFSYLQNPRNLTKELVFEKHHNVFLVNENGEKFINELYGYCSSLHILRTINEVGQTSLKNKTKNLLMEDFSSNINNIPKMLENVPRFKELQNDFIVLVSRFKRLEKDKMMGLINREGEAYETKNNQITEGLLRLIDELFDEE